MRRLVSLHLWSTHKNETLRAKAVGVLVEHTQKYKAELLEAQSTLSRLQQRNPMHTTAYFEAQWTRQRELQLKAINVTAKEKRARLEVLVQLEEDLIEARQRMDELNPRNVQLRTAEQRAEVHGLANSLASLEERIHEVAHELGNTQLRRIGQAPDDQIKALLVVQVAMGSLYEAKFDVIQQSADAALRTGATQQPRNEKLRMKKRALLKKKHATYLRHAEKYNRKHQRAPQLRLPTFDEVSDMDLLDSFWDETALDHPEEPWASCQQTREGIVAFRSQRSCEEELRRLGREVRQLMFWGLEYQARIQASRPNEANGEARLVEWRSVYRGLSRRTCRLWKQWEKGLFNVLHSTSQYLENSAEVDPMLKTRWQDMITLTEGTWAEILGVAIIWIEDDEEGEAEGDGHERDGDAHDY